MTFQSMLIYPLSCELIGGIGPWWAKQRSPWIPDSHFLAIVITTSPPPLTGLGEWAIPHSCALRGRNLDTHTHTYTHIPICHLWPHLGESLSLSFHLPSWADSQGNWHPTEDMPCYVLPRTHLSKCGCELTQTVWAAVHEVWIHVHKIVLMRRHCD